MRCFDALELYFEQVLVMSMSGLCSITDVTILDLRRIGTTILGFLANVLFSYSIYNILCSYNHRYTSCQVAWLESSSVCPLIHGHIKPTIPRLYDRFESLYNKCLSSSTEKAQFPRPSFIVGLVSHCLA